MISRYPKQRVKTKKTRKKKLKYVECDMMDWTTSNSSHNVLFEMGTKCVVTGSNYPQACHIYPFVAKERYDNTYASLFLLRHMWGIKKTQKWQDFLSKKIDTAENMIA